MKTRRRSLTGANRGNGGRNQNLCSLRSLLFKSERDGDVDFVFLAGCSRLSTYRLSTINHSETARIQSRLCSERRRDWLVQRRGRRELRAVTIPRFSTNINLGRIESGLLI